MIATHILVVTELVRMEECHRGWQIAMSPSNAINIREGVNEEHLGKAGAEADLSGLQPQHPQHGWECGRGQARAGHRQHSKEQIHGSMEAPLCPSGGKGGQVPPQCQEVCRAARSSRPRLSGFPRWKATQKER